MSICRIRSGIKEEEEEEEMVGGNSTTVRGYKREIKKEEEEEEMIVGSYSKRCKRSTLNSSPEEMLFEILARVPVQDIYGASRLVCKQWNRITRTKKFTHKHLEHASYGFFYMDKSRNTIFVCARKDGTGIDTCKLNYNIYYAVTSCNGLMLRYETPFGHLATTYWVENVLTGQALSLPPFRISLPFSCGSLTSCIGYAAASMTYKVVKAHCVNEGEGLSVFTVGVDVSWRSVCFDHLSPLGMKMLVNCCPIGTEGFVHWGCWRRKHAPFGCAVVTLNIETEVIKETSPPVEIKTMDYCFLPTGKYLSFFVMVTKLVWQVFEMKPDTLEWTRLPDMCLEGEKGTIQGLGLTGDVDIVPSCWLKYPEVLGLRIGCDIIFYSFITRKIGAGKLSTFSRYLRTILHKNSLEDLTTTNK